MTRRNFKYKEQVDRLWPVLDEIARRAWEREGVSHPLKIEVDRAAGEFLKQIRNATQNLNQELPIRIENSPKGQDVDKGGWSKFAIEELVDMIGRKDVCSIADAFLKANAILRLLSGTVSSGNKHFLFRGQRDIAWELLPRKGRALRVNDGWDPPRQVLDKHHKTQVLPEELESLAVFRRKWIKLDIVEDADRKKKLHKNHPEWWFRMQHYDSGEGTRLLDVTTSLTTALLFACVDWSSGNVDEKTDGVVYLWPEGMNCNVDDYLLQEMPAKAEGLFAQHPDAPRLILNPPHNERSKAQSGAFLWWSRFWQVAPNTPPYFLRVVASAKKSIVRDLLSMGLGPKEAVRGQKGLLNEQSLRSQLGFPGWNPLALGNLRPPKKCWQFWIKS